MMITPVAVVLAAVAFTQDPAAAPAPPVSPVRTERITPVRIATLDREGTVPERRLGGNPREVNGLLVFDGATDGNRQVDPQIAVGRHHVLTATNGGIIIYDKAGQYVRGVAQNAFAGGIDPKVFYDQHNDVYGFDLWVYWDDAKRKPVNIAVSETGDPTGAWNIYAVDAPAGVDGGSIGSSRRWTAYSFPGGTENTFVLSTTDMKAGVPTTAYHFEGSLGHPVLTQDAIDALYFLRVTDRAFIITVVETDEHGAPTAREVGRCAHELEFVGHPPPSPQKGTEQKTASGDRNPKNVVLQGGFLWFSQTINCRGRAAVQWHQIRLDGSIVQSGLLASETSSYIQTSLAVNRNLDVLVGFQETSPSMYISPRLAWRRATDPPGTMRAITAIGEGRGATDGQSWGDYSGSCIDGGNGLDLWTVQSITDDTGKGDTIIARVLMKAE
ncbi:MAG: hypothetical protein KC983_12235 [Phycisphaerales bacterium]|nr:hypothetical protein [Phycisphaerales bacterium]